MSKLFWKLSILLAAPGAMAFADTINFDNLCPSGQQASGPCSGLYSTVGNAETLDIATSIGTVSVQGGALFTNLSYLPADQTAVYGSAGNASGIGVVTSSGFTNPITITFPVALTSFSLDMFNGNVVNVEYQLADNAGNIQDMTLAPNFSGGLQSIALGATGTIVTIGALNGQSTPSGMTWDFLIDNINFTARSTTAPEPASFLFIGIGLLALGFLKRPARLLGVLAVGCSLFAATPTIASLNPPDATAGDATLTLTVNGSGFTTNSVVLWNGAPLPSTFVNATQVTATVAQNLLTTTETATVGVSNGSSASAGAMFYVEDPWTPIQDSDSNTQFGQIDPTVADSVVSDWMTGLFFADFNQLYMDGFTDGYLQVVEFDPSNPTAAPVWVVQNLPVENGMPIGAGGVAPPGVVQGRGEAFPLGVQAVGFLGAMPAARFHTPSQVPLNVVPAAIRNQLWIRQWMQYFAMQRFAFNGQGLLTTPPQNPPATADKVQPLDPKQQRTDDVPSLYDANSVRQKKMECAPSSVANSMQYLIDKQNVKTDNLKNVPSGQAGSRVGVLDGPMGYSPLGTTPYGLLLGKEAYLNTYYPSNGGKFPNGQVVMESQGKFCLDPTCTVSQNGSNGATPTEKFITDALTAKKDVEICFSWAAKPASAKPPSPASPAGAHCVWAVGYRWVNGYLTVDYTQDANQGGQGTVGLDWDSGGHMSMRIGSFNDQLWYRNFPGRPALITHVITEAPK